MRKFFSIAFIILILFNVLGYYGLFLGLSYTNDLAMTQKFDLEDYSDLETITIEIPLVLPYGGTSSDNFERVEGKFEHKGESFRLIKQRYANDTLYVVCVKDYEDARINNALGNYVKTFSDKPVDHTQNSKISFSFGKDYISGAFSIKHLAAGWQRNVLNAAVLPVFIADFHVSIIHPPERIA